jgi:hypothetical protein
MSRASFVPPFWKSSRSAIPSSAPHRSPGLAGHQHFFWFLAVFAAIGLTAGYMLMRRLQVANAAGRPLAAASGP